MKSRIVGRVKGQEYQVVQGDAVISSYPLSEARTDSKLAAAIKRNGWDAIPEE
jgi:hypothetical protein